MQIALALYDQFTVLDIIGPFQTLTAAAPDEVVWVADRIGPIPDHTGMCPLTATHTFDQITAPDIVVVPGGIGTEKLLHGHPIVDWVRAVHPTTTWTTSVCTGSLILAGAGLLDGKVATCHWAAADQLEALGAKPTLQRVVMHEADRIVTSAGVSSGIDMGLELIYHMHGEEAAQTVQLALEYDPQPITDAGSPERAPAHIVDLVKAVLSPA